MTAHIVDVPPARAAAPAAKALNWTGYIYGGLAHSAHLVYDEQSEVRGEQSVRRGLTRMGLTPDSVRGWRVMDVGTGGYALGFSRLGALVDHRDISTRTVAALSAYASERHPNLRSIHTDLVEQPLPDDTYDLIYLSGILQHFGDPGRALRNVSLALKVGGYLYVDIYRSGRWRWFVVNVLRQIASKDLLVDVLERFTEFCALADARSFHLRQVELLVDDLFVDDVHLFGPSDLEAVTAPLGLERVKPVTSMDLVDPPAGVDHSLFMAHVFNTLVCRRTSRGMSATSAASHTMTPRCQLGELDDLGGSYEAVAALTADFILAHRAGRFSRAQTVSHIVNLFRMAQPSWADDPYLVPGRREPRGSAQTAGDPETLLRRHQLWCTFLAHVLRAENPLPAAPLPSLGYELVRFIDPA